MRSVHSLVFGLALVLSACGGSQKPAEEPEAESAESESEDKAEEKTSEGEGDSEEANDAKPEADSKEKDAEPKSEPASDTSGPTVKRTPKDLLTAPDVIFMFSFNASDVKGKAEERCEGAKDPKKNADCMTKEKKKIDIDGMRFKQEKGRWYWMLVKRKGKTLQNVHKLPVEFEKETDTSIVLNPVGKDEGVKRGKGAPGETKIDVPNEYEISMKDPELGKMVFEAKIGLEGEQAR